MIWESRKYGDRRVVRRFAMFPIRCDDGKTVWLRWFYRTERWGTIVYNMEGDFMWTWVPEQWHSTNPAEKGVERGN